MGDSYSQVLEYLFQALPMFQRQGAAAYKANLDNTIQLLHALDNPQHKFASIHIAGTNGKGSSSHMIAAAFQEAGYKTGLYTSPHLTDFRERIRINGQKIPKQKVVDFTLKNKELFGTIQPSFFEMTVAMAFEYFAEEKVDIAIVETGMGGRLDSTNIIQPLLCLITNIGYDHSAFLGNSLPEIAREKAGIIKKNTPVVLSESNPETDPVFQEMASLMNAPLILAENNVHVQALNEDYQNQFTLYSLDSSNFSCQIKLPLMGKYQEKNLKGVVEALMQLRKNFPKLDAKAIQNGLEKVKLLTGLKGRWEILQNNPLCIADTGHNMNGMEWIIEQIKGLKFQRLFMVIGFVQDKDVRSILPLLPKQAYYIYTQAQIQRAMEAENLAHLAAEYGLKGEVEPDVKKAFLLAKNMAGKEDLIFVGGSTFVAAEVL